VAITDERSQTTPHVVSAGVASRTSNSAAAATVAAQQDFAQKDAAPTTGDVDGLAEDADSASPKERIRRRLNIYFAAATCLSGLTLAGNPATEMLPVIACFFAIFGLTFVDLLKWFSLPPAAAYVSLGAIALYSIGRFMDHAEASTAGGDDLQMVVVAELLVLVQAVLMLQQKNRRIYEQLAIFCLLELIVAAIFNDAVSFGLLLLPLGVVGAAALALLQTYQTTEEAFATGERKGESRRKTVAPSRHAIATVSAQRSSDSFHRAGLALPWMALTVLAPAVFLVALLFFYGLPRTSLASQRSSNRGIVGFSESVRLGEIRQMLQSDAMAARIDLSDRQTGKPYSVIDSLYLRGAVLEKYSTDPGNEGAWLSHLQRVTSTTTSLPLEHRDSRSTADDVRVRITLESAKSQALFGVPPYYRLATSPGILHEDDRWLLSRRGGYGLTSTGRTVYQFATTAFRDGEPSRYVPRFAFQDDRRGGTAADDTSSNQFDEVDRQRDQRNIDADRYVRLCLDYDEYRIPSAYRLSETLISAGLPTDNPLQMATAFERFLAFQGGFRYSLESTGESVPGLDPIEQFLSVDQRGNCQHFASALVLMLRSQGIPARIVVGYNSDEFNAMGGFYAARQLHAHAWVEALIDAQWVPQDELWHPVTDSDQYWVRLDPTPGGGGVDRATGGRVFEVLELAQYLWTDYVVHRTVPRPRADGSARDDSESASTAEYEGAVGWVIERLALIRAGQLGGGALAIGREFSWTAAVLSAGLVLLVLPLYQLGWPRGRRWSRSSVAGEEEIAVPRIVFFAETLKLLERIGIRRSIGQTPLELTTQAAAVLHQPGLVSLDGPLRLLTQAFYDTRFGGAAEPGASILTSADGELIAALRSVRERVELIESRSGPESH
jgi:protein-glutamine gamma-glutamyltransferase